MNKNLNTYMKSRAKIVIVNLYFFNESNLTISTFFRIHDQLTL